jgi:hypothetical protein
VTAKAGRSMADFANRALRIPAAPPAPVDVLEIRGQRVMLDERVAAAFGVLTKQLNQAYKRNLDRFSQADAFRLTDEEQSLLTSRIVTSKPGRGGRRHNSTVFTRRGVVTLATILRSPRARDAANQIIDLFVEVYAQINAGKSDITIASPEQFRAAGLSEEEQKTLKGLRKTLIEGLSDLVKAITQSNAANALRQAAQDLPAGLLSNLNDRLREKGLQNEKLSADIQLAYAQVEHVVAKARKTHAEADSVELANWQTKLDIMKNSLDLMRQLEPTAVVSSLQLLDRAPALGLPPPSSTPKEPS